MSTSLGFDEDRDKRPVPSRQADDAELAALLDVLARHRKFVQFIPAATGRQMRKDVQRMADLTGPRGVVSTWIGVFHDQDHPDWARGMLDFAGQLQAQGVRNYPQVSPRTLDIHVNWDGGMSWFALENSWHKMVQAPRPEKEPMLRDPRWRALAREEWDRVPRTMIPHKHADRIRLVSVTRPEHWSAGSARRWPISSPTAAATRPTSSPTGCSRTTSDAGIVGVGVANSDAGGVAETLTHPASVMANSDAGAHLQMMCAIGDTTLMLTRHVRERGDLSVEQAVHRMTGQLADRFGFAGRGRLTEGAAGDLAVFGLDELDWAADVFATDLPEGARRLRRPAGGYRYTVVGGTVVQQDGELTGARPGRVLRPGGLKRMGQRGSRSRVSCLVLLGEPLPMPGEMTSIAQHHHRLAPPQHRAGAGQGQFPGDVPATTLPPHGPGARVQRTPDRHGLDVGDRELPGNRQFSGQQRHMPQDLVEYAGGPAAVGDLRAAFVLRSADQVGVYRTVRLEFLAAEPQPAGPQAPARTAQGDG